MLLNTFLFFNFCTLFEYLSPPSLHSLSHGALFYFNANNKDEIES
jgi:hypothetical protein